MPPCFSPTVSLKSPVKPRIPHQKMRLPQQPLLLPFSAHSRTNWFFYSSIFAAVFKFLLCLGASFLVKRLRILIPLADVAGKSGSCIRRVNYIVLVQRKGGASPCLNIPTSKTHSVERAIGFSSAPSIRLILCAVGMNHVRWSTSCCSLVHLSMDTFSIISLHLEKLNS